MIFRTKTTQVQEIKPGIVELQFRTANTTNSLNVQTLKSIAKSLNIIKHFDNLQGLLITSDKEHFITSSNIYEYPYLFSYPDIELRAWIDYVKQLFLQLEQFPVPTVCALKGIALAEGCELALTCDFRVGDTTTQIGLPQIKFGLIPGLGGCVRLPHIIGMQHAIPLIINGSIIDAHQAEQIRLLDKVVAPGDLHSAAMDQLELAIQDVAGWQQRRQLKQDKLADDPTNAKLIVSEQQRLWKKLNRHYVAQFSAISLLADTWRIDRQHAFTQETNHYITLAKSAKSRTLINNYLNEQQIRQQVASNAKDKINQVAVIGAGSVGGDLSLQLASRDIAVQFKSTQRSLLESGMERVLARVNHAVAKQQLTQTAQQTVLSKIHPSMDSQGMDQVDIAIETLTDSLSVKQNLLKNIEMQISDKSIVVTNTSCVPIAELEKELTRPQQFCATHFFPPINQIPLVEIIPGSVTSDETLAKARSLVLQMGYIPVTVKDTPGFFVNRVYASYISALLLLIEDKVDIERIDRTMEKLGWLLGPAAQADALGLQMITMMLNHLHQLSPARVKEGKASLLQKCIDQGCYGRKSGAGLYNYEGDNNQSHKSSPLIHYYDHEYNQQIHNQEIEQRLMFALCNETIRCLDEGVIANHQQADVALIHTLGFPRYLGGVFQYLDNIGPHNYVRQLEQYSSLGGLYQPPAGILKKIKADEHYYHQPDIETEHIF